MSDSETRDTGEASGRNLDRLRAQVRADLARIAHPSMDWLTPKTAPDGRPALDVLIIGAGQSGLACGHGLMRARVDNILIVDGAARGCEGPWRSYARMATLRSPKDYTGPDLDLPSLTYQSWHEARYGEHSWRELGLIASGHWADYLDWVRDTLELPVRNRTTVTDITAAGPFLAATVETADGQSETLYARKIVLATGQDGMGVWWMPPVLGALPDHLRAHAADAIDFAALAGKSVAVLGAGASAFDNAAVALEQGARDVTLFCRRDRLQVIQPYRWLTFRGFINHLGDLDDAWRWRFMQHILGLREGFPQETYDRCARHDNFRVVAGAPWQSAREDNGRVRIVTARGDFAADFVIAGTGMDIDPTVRPELARFAGNIASWADRYTPPAAERNQRLARYPYLDQDYALIEKQPGETPWISNIHVFSIASTMSFGPSGSSINAMTTAVPKLVNGLTRGLFRVDVEEHWASLKAYDEPQAIVPGQAP